MSCGIYCIENLINGKKYIGQAININRRWNIHKCELRSNNHKNPHLQKSWNKHGEVVFIFYIIEECTPENLNERERYWITEFKTFDNLLYGYNMSNGGDVNTKRSKETGEKIRNKKLGVPRSKETRDILSRAFRGRKQSPEKIEKRASKIRGIPCSEESKLKISKSNTGKKATDATRQKMSDKKLNIPNIKNQGEGHGMSKLKDADVWDILTDYRNKKYSQNELARKYEVNQKTIFDIIHGNNWKNIYLKFIAEEDNQ